MSRRRDGALHQEWAQAAGRLLAEGWAEGYADARERAADELGLSAQTRDAPNNREIDAAMRAYQALFLAEETKQRVRAQREVAMHLMQELQAFEPRLVGPALAGTATQHTPINLHVFSDDPTALERFFHEKRVRFDADSRMYRFGGGREELMPLYRVNYQDEVVEVALFPEVGLRQPPLSALDQHAMERATRAQIEALLVDA
jgi:hypothetical protein